MGVWVLAPNKQKKSEAPYPGDFLRDIASNDHTCITQMTPNDPKRLQTKTGKKYVTKPGKGGDKTLFVFGVIRERCLKFEANTPWNLMRLVLGLGTREARRERKSRGSRTIRVVPFS